MNTNVQIMQFSKQKKIPLKAYLMEHSNKQGKI